MKQCLIVDQGLLSKIVEYQSLNSVHKKILELDILFFFKKHPNSNKEKDSLKEYYTMFKDCIELASYVPIELFFNALNDNSFVISVCSTALITSSNMGIMSISLLDMVKWRNENYKEEWRTSLTTASKGKILFPSSLECLKGLIM